MIRITCLFLFFAMTFGLTSCSKWPAGEFKDPAIELLQVEVVKARLLEQEFILHFRIENPNPMILPVRGMEYSLNLNGIRLAEGEATERFTVPAYGRQTFAVPVRTNLWRHMKDVVRMLKKPDEPVLYRLDAQVQTGLLFAHKVQLKRSGEIIPGNFIPE